MPAGAGSTPLRQGVHSHGPVEGRFVESQPLSFLVLRPSSYATSFLGALQGISRDSEWKWRTKTAGGRETTAVEIQRTYLQLVRDYAPPVEEEWNRLLQAWSDVLDDLERDPLSTSNRLDWSAKHRLIQQFRESAAITPTDPCLLLLDLSYHHLVP